MGLIEENELENGRGADGRFLPGHSLQQIYRNPNELQKAIDEYFDELNGETPTMSGLALHLGFTSRRSLVDYGHKDDFADVIKVARLKIEAELEKKLINQKTFHPGLIFALKQYGWADKSELDVRSQNVTLTGFTLHTPDEDRHQTD